MIYFDSDVLVNYFIVQDSLKNKQAHDLYKNATDQKLFLCSVLALSETSYVLSRLNIQSAEITKMIDSIFLGSTASITIAHFKRAIELAKIIGFQHINDCLHTAIAEAYCDELYTYNKADFRRIQKHTRLKITTL